MSPTPAAASRAWPTAHPRRACFPPAPVTPARRAARSRWPRAPARSASNLPRPRPTRIEEDRRHAMIREILRHLRIDARCHHRHAGRFVLDHLPKVAVLGGRWELLDPVRNAAVVRIAQSDDVLASDPLQIVEPATTRPDHPDIQLLIRRRCRPRRTRGSHMPPRCQCRRLSQKRATRRTSHGRPRMWGESQNRVLAGSARRIQAGRSVAGGTQMLRPSSKLDGQRGLPAIVSGQTTATALDSEVDSRRRMIPPLSSLIRTRGEGSRRRPFACNGLSLTNRET